MLGGNDYGVTAFNKTVSYIEDLPFTLNARDKNRLGSLCSLLVTALCCSFMFGMEVLPSSEPLLPVDDHPAVIYSLGYERRLLCTLTGSQLGKGKRKAIQSRSNGRQKQ